MPSHSNIILALHNTYFPSGSHAIITLLFLLPGSSFYFINTLFPSIIIFNFFFYFTYYIASVSTLNDSI